MILLIAMLSALGGALLHILGKFAELEETKRRFNPKKWLKKNLWRTLFGIGGSLGGVYVMYQLGDLNMYAAFMAGYMGDSLAKKGQKSEH